MFPRIVSIIILISISTNLFAAGSISVQGVLRKANGSAVLDSDVNGDGITDNHYNFIFTIYTSEFGGSVLSTCPGSCIFNYDSHPVKNGVYSVELPVGEYLHESGDHWVGVEVNNNQLSPRLKLNVTPYEQLYLADGSSNIVLENGRVGLGTEDPSSYLDVAGGRIKDQSGYVAPVGTVVMYAGTTAPEGWLFCMGGNIPAGSQYDELRTVLGSNYGGNEKLPDMSGRVPVGRHANDGWFDSVSDRYGWYQIQLRDHSHNHSHTYNPDSETFTHGSQVTGNNNQSHSHQQSVYDYSCAWNGGLTYNSGGGGQCNMWYATTGTQTANHNHTFTTSVTVDLQNQSTAPGTANASWHGTNDEGLTMQAAWYDKGNMPPYQTLNFIIKY